MKNHYSITVLFAIALLVTLFVCVLYGYMYYIVGNSLEKALVAREEVKKEQAYKDQGESSVSLSETTKNDRAMLNTFFVDDEDKVTFIEMIESLGDRTGSAVTLSSIVADDLATSPVGTQGHVKINVEAQGSWSSVMRTLILAENLPYKITVTSIRLDTSGTLDAKNPKQSWKLSFVLDALSIHNPK